MSDDPVYDTWADRGRPYLIVKTLEDLGPPPVREGAVIFVEDICSLRRYKGGQWVSADTYLVCPANDQETGRACVRNIWVSPVDQDASLSQMFEHLFSRHAGHDQNKAYELLTKVKEVDEDGKVVPPRYR